MAGAGAGAGAGEKEVSHMGGESDWMRMRMRRVYAVGMHAGVKSAFPFVIRSSFGLWPSNDAELSPY